MSQSWKPEVFVDGGWNGNALRFATEKEASSYAADLFRRWTLTTDYRAVPSDEPVNYAIIEGELAPLPEKAVAS